MTDSTQAQATAEGTPDTPAPPKAKKPFVIPFHALIRVISPVRAVEAGAEVQLGQERVGVQAKAQQELSLQEDPPEPDRPYAVVLWFRTNEGQVQDLEFASFTPLKSKVAENVELGKAKFEVGARLKAVDREEGFLVMEVELTSCSLGGGRQKCVLEGINRIKFELEGSTTHFGDEREPYGSRQVAPVRP